MPVLRAPAPLDPDDIDWWEDETVPVDEEHGDLFEQLYGNAPIARSIEDFYPEDDSDF